LKKTVRFEREREREQKIPNMKPLLDMENVAKEHRDSELEGVFFSF
jgi:hypothetical protein